MIKIGCLLKVKDNTGINKIKLIGCLKKKNKSIKIGDLLIGTIKKTSNPLYKKSSILLMVLIKTKKPYLRKDGSSIRFFENGVIIIDKTYSPKGTHIFGPLPYEIKEKFKKLSSLTNHLV